MISYAGGTDISKSDDWKIFLKKWTYLFKKFGLEVLGALDGTGFASIVLIYLQT